MDSQTRVAIYARVSTIGHGQDTENQLAELRAFVARKGAEEWVLTDTYVDQASGKNADRPEFKRMFVDAAERRFDLVLFWSLDRFSREGVLETLQHLQRLTSHGIEWYSLKEEYLRSIGIFRDAVLSILATIAKQERIRLSERVKAGLVRTKAKGTTLGRPRRVVDRKKIMDLRSSGKSLSQIAKAVDVSVMTVQRIIKAHGSE